MAVEEGVAIVSREGQVPEVTQYVATHVKEGAAGKLGLVQIAPDAVSHFPALIAALSKQDRAFLLFVDDLGFEADSAQENLSLRSLLDGGIVAQSIAF